jgi:hypothetical protein
LPVNKTSNNLQKSTSNNRTYAFEEQNKLQEYLSEIKAADSLICDAALGFNCVSTIERSTIERRLYLKKIAIIIIKMGYENGIYARRSRKGLHRIQKRNGRGITQKK